MVVNFVGKNKGSRFITRAAPIMSVFTPRLLRGVGRGISGEALKQGNAGSRIAGSQNAGLLEA